MPHALMSGHAMSVNDPLISSIFNAISIGFTSPDMIEGVTPVSEGVQDYHNWMTIPTHSPHITMIESAVRLQLGCKCTVLESWLGSGVVNLLFRFTCTQSSCV